MVMSTVKKSWKYFFSLILVFVCTKDFMNTRVEKLITSVFFFLKNFWLLCLTIGTYFILFFTPMWTRTRSERIVCALLLTFAKEVIICNSVCKCVCELPGHNYTPIVTNVYYKVCLRQVLKPSFMPLFRQNCPVE